MSELENQVLLITKTLQIFGAIPVKNGAEITKKFKNFSKYYIMFLYVILLILFVFSLLYSVKVREINYFVNQMTSIASFITLSFVYLTSLCKKDKILKVLDNFRQFDQNAITQFGQESNYHSVKKITLILFFGVAIILCQSCSTDLAVLVVGYKSETIYRWLILSFSTIVDAFYQAWITLQAFLLYQRFSLVNKALENICSRKYVKYIQIYPKIKISSSSKSMIIEDCSVIGVLKKAKVLNEEVRILANDICSCYSSAILSSWTTAFFVLTAGSYYLILVLSSKVDNKEVTMEDKYKISASLIFFIIIHTSKILMVVSSFHVTRKEVSHFYYQFKTYILKK